MKFCYYISFWKVSFTIIDEVSSCFTFIIKLQYSTLTVILHYIAAVEEWNEKQIGQVRVGEKRKEI